MFRVRLAIASALLVCAAPVATSTSHAVQCTPLTADVCATYVFVCERLAYHDINLALCHLT